MSWVKLHRKLNHTSFKRNPLVLALFVHLLINVNHEDNKIIWNKEELLVKAGSIVTGRKVLSFETGISEQSIRTCLNILKSTNTITISVYSKFSVISINNWIEYQGSTSKSTNNQPAANQQLTTNKNIEKDKNIKNKDISGVENSTPTDSVKEIYDFYIEKTGRAEKLSPLRRQKIKSRIKEFGVEDCKRAILGMLSDPFMTGDNDRGWKADLDYIFRNYEKTEKCLQLAITNNKDERPESVDPLVRASLAHSAKSKV